MKLFFRKSGALGLPTIIIIGKDVDSILAYALAHNLEFMPHGPCIDCTIIKL